MKEVVSYPRSFTVLNPNGKTDIEVGDTFALCSGAPRNTVDGNRNEMPYAQNGSETIIGFNLDDIQQAINPA